MAMWPGLGPSRSRDAANRRSSPSCCFARCTNQALCADGQHLPKGWLVKGGKGFIGGLPNLGVRGLICSQGCRPDCRMLSKPILIQRKTNTYTEPGATGEVGPTANAFVDTSGIHGARKAAFFDVDGTICKTNVVMAYYTARVGELSFCLRFIWLPCFVLTCIFYLVVDWFDRPTFNRIFYRSYRGRSVQSKPVLADIIYRKYYKPRVFKDATAVIKRLKAEGYKIILVTGSLDFLVAPLAKDLGADFVYAAELTEENGRLTGDLKGMFASNDEKAIRIKHYADEHEIPLDNCFGFGDSIADLPMLEAVGRPYVVNPDSRLRAMALKRGWPIMQWVLHPAKLPNAA